MSAPVLESPMSSGTVDAVPSTPRHVRGGTVEGTVEYVLVAPFVGHRYEVEAVPKSNDALEVVRHLLMAEGYREQAPDALWFAESTLAAAVEDLPEP